MAMARSGPTGSKLEEVRLVPDSVRDGPSLLVPTSPSGRRSIRSSSNEDEAEDPLASGSELDDAPKPEVDPAPALGSGITIPPTAEVTFPRVSVAVTVTG
jgi:hypothetical protein